MTQRQVDFAKAKLAVVLALIVLAVLLSGCDRTGPVIPAKQWGYDQCLRAELFQACMKALPDGPVAPKYNDWDEVVDSCENAAQYQSVRADFRTIKPECRS